MNNCQAELVEDWYFRKNSHCNRLSVTIKARKYTLLFCIYEWDYYFNLPGYTTHICIYKETAMKAMLKIEEVCFFMLSVFLFSQLEYSWWWFPALILVPDIGMIGYLISTSTGAKIYNIVHHRAVSILLYIIGSIMSSPIFQLIGIILFAHSTLDRIFNYGLKYPDDFKHTHLSEGWSD